MSDVARRACATLASERNDNMAIPDYQSLMLPLLRFIEDKQEHSLREAIDALGAQFEFDRRRNERAAAQRAAGNL